MKNISGFMRDLPTYEQIDKAKEKKDTHLTKLNSHRRNISV
jgi:hypothetical protein